MIIFTLFIALIVILVVIMLKADKETEKRYKEEMEPILEELLNAGFSCSTVPHSDHYYIMAFDVLGNELDIHARTALVKYRKNVIFPDVEHVLNKTK